MSRPVARWLLLLTMLAGLSALAEVLDDGSVDPMEWMH